MHPIAVKSIHNSTSNQLTMASASNIYAADPAFPTLAHTLLTDTDSKVEDAEHASSDAVNDDWNLQEDWNAGIQSKSKIFRSGTVIGFSRLRMNSHDSNEYIGQVQSLKPIISCRNI